MRGEGCRLAKDTSPFPDLGSVRTQDPSLPPLPVLTEVSEDRVRGPAGVLGQTAELEGREARTGGLRGRN